MKSFTIIWNVLLKISKRFQGYFFDKSRLSWEAAADFKVVDRQTLLNRIGRDDRFSYIERPNWTAVEFKTADTLIYFLEPLASEVYDKPMKKS